MIFLLLLCLGIGGGIGLIARAAHLQPTTWQLFAWVRMFILGAGYAFCGAWLSILFLGRSFTIPMALWIAVIGVGLPRLIQRSLLARRGTKVSRLHSKKEVITS